MPSTQEGGRIDRWLQRHSASLVALLAVVVSALQLRISSKQSETALNFQKTSADRDHALAERQLEQQRSQWTLSLAQFVAANHKELFSPDSATRERMKAIIQISYPESQWSSVFRSLVRVSPDPGIKKTYASIQTRLPMQDSTTLRGGVVTVVITGKTDARVDGPLLNRLDVYMKRNDNPGLPSSYPAQPIGAASALVLTKHGVALGGYRCTTLSIAPSTIRRCSLRRSRFGDGCTRREPVANLGPTARRLTRSRGARHWIRPRSLQLSASGLRSTQRRSDEMRHVSGMHVKRMASVGHPSYFG
jgi:hypothetical protein